MRYALICLGLIACGDKETDNTPEPTDFTDEDDDGYTAGADCDDGDATVFPGADELCDNIDNDCDGEVDENPAGATVIWEDGDGDGFGDGDTRTEACEIPAGWVDVGGDCDDTNDAIHPDADELCDGVDNNCDDKKDNDPVDTTTFYIDADLDGFGSDATTVDSCDMPVGFADNDDDCDDSDPRTSPDADEISCDGADNNCDGRTDADVVPRDHATIQDAIDALADGGEICLSSGTYTDQLDLSGRRLTLTGQDGPRSTRFDIGSSWPQVSVTGGGNITIQNISLQGPEVALTGGDTSLYGAFASVQESAITLHNVQVNDAVVSVADGADLYGLLVHGENADITVTDLLVDAASFTYVGGGDGGSMNIDGGIISGSDGSTIDLYGIEMVDTVVGTSGDRPERCDANGFLVYSRDGALTGGDIAFTNAAYDVDCSDGVYLDGLAIAAFYSSEDLTNVSVTGNTATLASSSSAYGHGLVRVFDSDNEGTHQWSVVDISSNDFTTTNDSSSSYNYGPMQATAELYLSHYTAYGNNVRAEATGTSTSGYAYGGGLRVSGGGMLSHIDMRGNDLYGAAYGYGGGAAFTAYEEMGGSWMITNLLAVSNTVETDRADAQGGGLYFYASDPGAYTLVNADIVENTVTAGDDCHGGGLRWFPDGASDVLTVTNVTFTGNACTGATSAAGQAVSLYAADAPTVAWTYNNIFDQPTDAFDGMDDPTGNNGNVSEDPKYVSTSGTPSNWDLRLSVRSDLVDLGDPSILDADGTTSDIGAYGGPAGEDW